eukprot:1143519-Pelagomonas_calceolata.AAC.3
MRNHRGGHNRAMGRMTKNGMLGSRTGAWRNACDWQTGCSSTCGFSDPDEGAGVDDGPEAGLGGLKVRPSMHGRILPLEARVETQVGRHRLVPPIWQARSLQAVMQGVVGNALHGEAEESSTWKAEGSSGLREAESGMDCAKCGVG